MYNRIFPTQTMNTGVCILGFMVLAWWIAVIFVSLFQCSPIPAAWDKALLAKGATCIDDNKFFIGNAVPNIITDLLILTLPIYEVYRLQMSTLQKAAVSGLFLLGGT